MASRAIQHKRFEGMKIYCNSLMVARQVRQFCRIDEDSQQLLRQAMEKLGSSARLHTVGADFSFHSSSCSRTACSIVTASVCDSLT